MYPIGANGTVVQKNYTEAAAPVYIISGAAGCVEGLVHGRITQPYTAFLQYKRFGLGLLTVHNATHLDWDFYASKDEELLDHITLVKVTRWQQWQKEKAALRQS